MKVVKELLIPTVWSENEKALQTRINDAARELSTNLVETNIVEKRSAEAVEKLCLKAVRG